MKVKDLSPSMSLLTAEAELLTPFISGESPMANSIGGLSMFADSFKRGYGDQVFGSDGRGIWLGAADFDHAPFKVDMDGNVTALSATLTDYISTVDTNQELEGEFNVGDTTGGYVKIDGANKRILIHDGTTNRAVFGEL